jgi:rhodanese-related sulfurtransferase
MGGLPGGGGCRVKGAAGDATTNLESYNPWFCAPDGSDVNFFLENWLLIAVAFVSGGMLVWPLVRGGGGAGAVSASEAVRLMNREKAVLIDVSEPREFDASHAAQARNVPIGQLETSKELPSNKALPLVVLCPTGARAGRAAATLRKLGYANVRALSGGTAAWRDAGLPVEKSAVTAAG